MAFTGGPASVEREAGVLSLAIKNMSIELDGLTDLTKAMQEFADRVVEPRPVPPSAHTAENIGRIDRAVPTSPSLETQLSMLGRRLETLHNMLRTTLHRLNAAL